MEEKVSFMTCDMRTFSPFMLHIHAAVAEEEARAISRRTHVAPAAAKARGTVPEGWKVALWWTGSREQRRTGRRRKPSLRALAAGDGPDPAGQSLRQTASELTLERHQDSTRRDLERSRRPYCQGAVGRGWASEGGWPERRSRYPCV